jgi:methionyl-tRNA synthetase
VTRRVLITATPPTPNGDLHVGHLAGPYLGADVFRRYRLAQGHAAALITSTDDHQTYLERKAEVRGETPEQTASHFAGLISRTLSLAAIEVDAFTTPVASPDHDRLVGALFRRLVENGAIKPAETPVLHCDECRRDLVDYDCVGRCANCGEGCDVGICEECGHPSSPTTLIEPRCTRCVAQPRLTSITRLCLDLEEQRPALEAYHAVVRSRPHTRRLWEELSATRLPLVPVAHPGSWGIPTGVPGFESHRWWGMAEMGPGYVATTAALDPGTWGGLWHDADAEVVQFFGFDNSYWQTLIHPALFMADGLRTADHFVVNEFYLLDGFKFSSSKNHAVWGADLLQTVPADALRYYACLTGPEESQTDFTLAQFRDTVNAELAGQVDAAVAALLVAASSSRAGTGDALTKQAVVTAESMGASFEPQTFSLAAAVRTWRNTIVALAASAQSSDPPAADAAAALAVMATAIAPVMPDFATRLWPAAGDHTWAAPPAAPVLPSRPLDGPWFGEVG